MAPKKEPKPKKNAPKPGSPGGAAAVPKQSQQKPAAEVASDQQPLLAEKMERSDALPTSKASPNVPAEKPSSATPATGGTIFSPGSCCLGLLALVLLLSMFLDGLKQWLLATSARAPRLHARAACLAPPRAQYLMRARVCVSFCKQTNGSGRARVPTPSRPTRAYRHPSQPALRCLPTSRSAPTA